MSLDNVIAIAGAAEQADPSQRTGLIIFGLLVSVPFIVFGSQIILKLLDRYPIIILLGGALLGWIAGGLMVTDPVAEPFVPQTDTLRYVASAAGAVFVVAVAKCSHAVATSHPGHDPPMNVALDFALKTIRGWCVRSTRTRSVRIRRVACSRLPMAGRVQRRRGRQRDGDQFRAGAIVVGALRFARQ